MPDESATRSGLALPATPPVRGRTVVRRARPTDLELLVELRLALLREEARNPLFARPHPDARRRAARLTKAELEGPGQVHFVAVRGRVIVGMLRCRAIRRTPLVAGPRHAVVTTVYVVPAARRSGVLRALLAAADRWCRRHRLTGMRLNCALANATGRQSWESLGFQPAELLYLRDVPPT